MSIKERKEREKEEMRELILDAANEIITTEGIESISVRKIASRIEYSPTIIYHYFLDKDDIINQVMKRGYQKIVSTLSSVQALSETPEKRLEEQIRRYIDTALLMSDEYKAAHLSTSPAVLEHTSSLFRGASAKKPALGILSQCLKDIFRDRNLDDSLIELTSQIIAAATFGLIIKLIIEKDIGKEQRENLIEHHIRCIVGGMIMGNTLDKYQQEENVL